MKPISVQHINSQVRRALLPFVLMTLLTGCAAAPVQEMSDARQAVNAAMQSGAPTIAPTQMNSAQAALNMAERLLRDHQFGAARHYAQSARTKAIEAQEIAQGKNHSSR